MLGGRWIGLPQRLMNALMTITGQLLFIIKQNERLIAIMTTTQADLDAITAGLEAIRTQLSTEITALEAQAGAAGLDLTGLKKVEAEFAGLVTPATPAPVDGGVPVADGQTPAV